MNSSADAELSWPDDAIAWHGVFDAVPEWSVDYGVDVWIFKTLEGLRDACGDPAATAFSRTYDTPDAAGVGALMLFVGPVPISLIAHEVAHVALFWARDLATPHQRARRWLAEHPEAVAELVGNLTAVLWHSLPEDLLDS